MVRVLDSSAECPGFIPAALSEGCWGVGRFWKQIEKPCAGHRHQASQINGHHYHPCPRTTYTVLPGSDIWVSGVTGEIHGQHQQHPFPPDLCIYSGSHTGGQACANPQRLGDKRANIKYIYLAKWLQYYSCKNINTHIWMIFFVIFPF